MSIQLAKGFQIQMLESLHLCVAVGEGQTLEQRMNKRKFELVKPDQDEFSQAQINLGGTVSNFNMAYIEKQIAASEPPPPQQRQGS